MSLNPVVILGKLPAEIEANLPTTDTGHA